MQDDGHALWWLNSGSSMAGEFPHKKVGSTVLLRVKTFFEAWNLASDVSKHGCFPTLLKVDDLERLNDDREAPQIDRQVL